MLASLDKLNNAVHYEKNDIDIMNYWIAINQYTYGEKEFKGAKKLYEKLGFLLDKNNGTKVNYRLVLSNYELHIGNLSR